MKYHKIRDVDKSICTAEQKVAYNMAWQIRMDSRYNLDSTDVVSWTAIQLDEVITTAIRDYTVYYMAHGGKYNIDAIFSALRAGLRCYILGGAHILTSYTDIGEMFPAHYLVD